MEKALMIFSTLVGLIILVGLFSPWLELNSRPYILEGKRIRDHAEITGWNFIQGRFHIVRMIESIECLCWKEYDVIDAPVERKIYAYMNLIGGLLLISSSICALGLRRKIHYVILVILIGGILAFAGGSWGFWDNRWIRYSLITMDGYSLYGYYRYGILLCTIGGIIAIIGAVCLWILSK